jgi:hypothetical protein
MAEIKNIFIEGTAKTPNIDFNRHTGELILSGKSIPENAAKVYEPLLTWIEDYVKSPRHTTNLRLNLEYFNSASSIWFAKLVKALSRIKEDDYVLFIHLYFDIEDYDSMDNEELKDFVSSLVDKIGDAKVSIGVRTHGIDSDGKIVRDSTILI